MLNFFAFFYVKLRQAQHVPIQRLEMSNVWKQSGPDDGKSVLQHKRVQRQPPKAVPKKIVLKICSKFTGEHPCRSVILIKLQSNFIEIALRHVCPPVNLLHILRAPFPKKQICRAVSGGFCFKWFYADSVIKWK